MTYTLRPGRKSGKKWTITTPSGTSVSFGAVGYSDYTMHHDDARKANYVSRHQRREKWGKDGLDTAGFWSRWLLWNKQSIQASAKDIEQRFGIKIVMYSPEQSYLSHCSALEGCIAAKRK